MRRNFYYLLLLLLLVVTQAGAQNIRYVSKSGAYANDGKSWATAKINVQDAINDLVDNGLTGEVWVAAGTYTPTESTESSGGSTLYMSFKIPAGIKVYGGFAGTETSKDQRAKTTYENLGWRYTNHTTLSGNLSAKAEFSWNSSKKVFNTSFYGNSYHVVWFANNGFDANGRANALSDDALLEGFIIEGGNARNTALTGRSHTAYGGGIYMVEGATVQNCYVTNCEASRDGGGIYMDGGGTVEHTLIANCQALGVSIDNGYGGGVCLDGNASENKFGISRSMIYNCVARYGGGMAINVGTSKSAAGNDIRYKPYAAAMIITNNTATSEGGGVYLNRGGAVTQLTVVANQCNGQGVTSNGITNGRAAGIYCRDNSYVINSVLWGGECAANNNAQYAASRSSYSDDLKTHMWYCSLSKSGYVDWSSTKKINVMSLSDYNTKTLETAAGVTSGASVGYPVFAKPTPSAGHLGNDVFDFASTYSWQPQAVSALLNAGIRSIELDLDGILPFPLVLYDLVDAQFKPHATIGGYVAKGLTISPQTSGSTVNIYVDDAGTQGAEATSIGSSWDTPIRYLGNALQYVKDNATTLSGMTVNIYVKEGTYDNTNSYVNGRLRMVPIDVPGNVNLYGGYPDELTGTDLTATINGTLYQRNPLRYPSVITGKVTNDFDVNVAHLVTFNGSTDVVFDGFQVRYANASSTLLTNTDKNGGGMIFSNGAHVSVRNTLIAGCTAEKGAAIFATGASQVTFVNCIVHNNTSSNLNGIIYSEGTANLTFDQCDFLRNVGYVGYLEGTDTKQAYTNSIFFANMDRAIDNTNAENGGGIQYSLPSFAGNTAGVSGSYCMFDSRSAQFSAQFGGNPLGKWQYNLQYTFAGGADNGYPRFVNPTKNTGVSPGGDATFNGRATSFEPNNTNPVVNAAYAVGDHTAWGTDISAVTTRDYGGRLDIGAVENHQATHEAEGENAYTTGQPAYGSVVYVRDYNTYTYNADGTMTKTAEDLTTNDRDGLSCERAINGNATYGSATTFDDYNLSTPEASTIASPKPYKIGMLLGNTAGNAVYYAKQNGTTVYMNGTSTAASGDDFILIATATTGVYNIYNVTRNLYVTYNSTTTGANKIVLQATNTTNATWRIISVNTAANYQTYVIQPGVYNSISSASWNYYGGAAGGNNIGLYAGTDANSKWQFYVKVTTTGTVDVNGFQYALNNANALYKSTGKAHKVWVGAGNYTTTLIMRDGAPAYGGFPKSGTPGESERNISNTVTDYKTIIDANKAGRVLTQSAAFADTTMFEGFILRNGATNADKVYITGTSAAATDYQAFYDACKANEPFVRAADGTTTYALKSTATQCINQGSQEDVLAAQDITEDIVGSNRVQDCTVDKGAYEYNDAYGITPDTKSVSGQAIFYVTPEGHGLALSSSPGNAACAAKLQTVLDAAGRYKYTNPSARVIVKLANSSSLEGTNTPFKYYATRTTDETDQDVRLWSIMVPRGVEIWGGYTDTYTSETDNGFFKNDGTYTDRRNITGHPTYLDSYYYNTLQKNEAYTYHVVTFTDYVFDGSGLPYRASDNLLSASTFTSYQDDLMSMSKATTDRAVIDGLFVTGGNANLQVTSSGSTTRDINQYGGAAIVTDYAHVRNCIIRDNKGTYGGALALTHRAMVSGTLIDRNTAEYGGALYFFEDGVELSDGTIVDTKQGSGTTLDANMAHVYTSTIVNNLANAQGGGIWFGQGEANVRINSSVVWQNDSPDQANVSGLSNPEKPADNNMGSTEFYPFSFSAVQNVRLSGTNNIDLPNTNREGTRFVKAGSTDQVTLAKESGAEGFDNFSDFGYYGLTNYSVLVKTGMSINDYEALKSIGVTDADFVGLDRVTSSTARSFIDIGTRAIDKRINTDNLMLRLYVMKPEDVNMDAAETMMQLRTDPNADVAYYAQKGSSFAYPMQSLQDALDYVYAARAIKPDGTLAIADANNMPFEIVVAKGTYYPSRNLRGVYGYSVDNTFLIPEGVAILGGFSGKRAVDRKGTAYSTNNFFGRFRTKGTVKVPDYANDYYYLTDNTDTLTTEALIIGDYTIRQLPMETMTKYRPHADINANNIIEPWEFTNQTVLSGNVNNVPGSGVLHVVSVFADQTVAGALPKPSMDRSSTYVSDKSNANYGYTIREDGQPIVLDGLTITGGYARNYVTGSIDDNEKLYYEHGGGLYADGNRYCDDYNKGTGTGVQFMHTEVSNPISYRDVSVIVNQCKFEDNHAGYGGAIAMNSSLNVYSFSFEHNIAEAGEDKNVDFNGKTYTVNYPGQGGAIFSTNYLTALNTIFANNEARDVNYSTEPREIVNLRHLAADGYVTPKLLGGSGGAIYMGKSGYYHLFNCNFVHNMANAYPAVCTMNPNTKEPAQGAANYNMTLAGFSQIFNSVFWGNEVSNEMKSKNSTNAPFLFAGQLITTYGKPDRTTDYNATFTADNVPTSQADLDANYQEMAWFSAYEAGRGITPVNAVDLRGLAIDPMHHIITQLKAAAETQGGSYQNCNIEISSDNESLDGPNFVNPSLRAGYDGYVESADWSPSRLYKLSDNGSGKIDQVITQGTDGTYQAQFKTYDASTVSQVPTDYSAATVGDYMTSGAYSTYRYWKYNMFYHKFVPIGTDPYMTSAYVQEDGSQQQLYSISYDPNPTHNQTYIDIGVYEYPHTPLQYTTVGDEVDILWVSPIEKPDNGLPDGSAWSQPTSDLQRAIETLLASRNGHRKEIRLLDGSYTPIYTINNRLAFTINTYDLNDAVELPEAKEGYTSEGHGVRSLTIKGGYSRELNNIYDVDAYPAIFRQQTRTDASSDKWDHLIYITDATQRYGLQSSSGGNPYNLDNGFGWWRTAAEQTNKPVNTIPIEIDGVRVINDQARTGTNGAGIYYGPQTFDSNLQLDPLSTSPAHKATAPTPVNISKITYYTDENKTAVSETPTNYYTREDGYEVKTTPAKIIVSKTTILGTGTKNDKTTNAVYISSTGGSALLYNNLMHSNYGEPLHAECPTTVVNNTFALNASVVNISGDAAGDSKIYNSVFWRNNATGTDSYGEQFKLQGYVDVATSGDIFKRNAYTGGNITETSYADGNTIAKNNYNVGLTVNNNDVINGPNFIDPENTDIEARNFGINPSLRLLNKGDNALYNDDLTSAYNIYDLAWLTTTRHDAASNNRIVSSIDLGAFEYQNNLERVLYVNPNSSVTGVGNSWASPLGYGSLQTALDLAAIYHVNNPTEEAYVFVKGASLTNYKLHTGETLVMRNGVALYGSINPSVNADCAKTTDANGVSTFDAAVLKAYVDSIRAARGGIVGPTGNKTTVSGILVPQQTVFDTTGSIYSLIDGVEVTATTATNTTGTVSAPVIDVRSQTDGATVVLRNIIMRGSNVTTAGVNAAEVDNALLYEALLHTNTVTTNAAVLHIGSKGYAVNITADGTTIGADGLTTYNGSDSGNGSTTGQIYNSLVNYANQPATYNTLSGSHYRVSRVNLNHQLMAKSTHIDECEPVNPLTGVADNLAAFINYATDLDLLGNPRLLKGVTSADKIDRGAFETWRIDQKAVTTSSKDNYYPHEGSVVYILEGNTLVSGNTLNPAFLLLEKGASLYGQGHAVNASYLAVEREVPAGGAVVSLPYAMDYATHAAKVTYADDGELTLTPAGSTFTYNGLKRSAWNYQFLKSNSGSWEALATTAAANQGVLFVPTEAGTYRFTGQGASMQDYIYREVQDETFKTVTLTQNDDYRSDYGGADFTSKEDMGWNCFGLSYLVSAYKPYTTESFTTTSRYNMDIPHKLWLYYDGAAAPDGSTVNGDGGYYSVSSWDTTDNWHLPTGSVPSIWVGEGIFTQTAAVNSTEDLTFYRPVYESASGAKAAPTLTRAYVGTIEQEVATTFSITVRGHIIYVTGLEGDEQITIYDRVGRIYNTAQATSARYSTAVPTNGIYIVRVNDVSKKVLIK